MAPGGGGGETGAGGRTPSYCRNFDPQTRKVPVICLQLPYPANYLATSHCCRSNSFMLPFYDVAFRSPVSQENFNLLSNWSCTQASTRSDVLHFPISGGKHYACVWASEINFWTFSLRFNLIPKAEKDCNATFTVFFRIYLLICMSALFAWHYRLLWAIMWLLGIEIETSGRTASA